MLKAPARRLKGLFLIHPLQRRVPRAHDALSQVVPTVDEMLGRDLVKLASTSVPVGFVGNVLCGRFVSLLLL